MKKINFRKLTRKLKEFNLKKVLEDGNVTYVSDGPTYSYGFYCGASTNCDIMVVPEVIPCYGCYLINEKCQHVVPGSLLYNVYSFHPLRDYRNIIGKCYSDQSLFDLLKKIDNRKRRIYIVK